jgi:hypothetical protein
MAPIKKPLDRTVRRQIQTPYGPLIATLTAEGVTLRPTGKSKGVSLSYEQIAKHGLAKLQHVRWPKTMESNPFEQMQHLSRRPV